MFKFNKAINSWSEDVTRDLEKIWGKDIPRTNNNTNKIAKKFLLEYLNNYFQKYEKIIFLKFKKITKKKYNSSSLRYFINNTLFSLHNTEKNFISIGAHHSFSSYPTIIIHEIFHVIFYDYIKSTDFLGRYEKKFGEKLDVETLNEMKEVVTTIINIEFENEIFTQDKGYPEHLETRKIIDAIWKKNKNFPLLLEKIAKNIKEKRG